MVHNNPDIDLVSDNEYTRFGLILSIHSYNMEQKSKSYYMSIKGHNSVVNLRKTKIYIINVDLVNDNVYTKFTTAR